MPTPRRTYRSKRRRRGKGRDRGHHLSSRCRPRHFRPAPDGGEWRRDRTQRSAAGFLANWISVRAAPASWRCTIPAPRRLARLKNVRAGDVLELPGTSVNNVTFGSNGLSVTTNTGVYAFTNVSYDDALTSYSTAIDPVTGLVAITFADQIRVHAEHQGEQRTAEWRLPMEQCRKLDRRCSG